jgi:oligo-1,6-glucosidase
MQDRYSCGVLMTTRRAFFNQVCASFAALTTLSHPVRALGELLSPAVSAEPWWKAGVLYQIYPRSFQDSNGDGLGDFPGMTSRLHHLRSLGVDAVWITACFDSPNADNGYDVRDYRLISPVFGTMHDFDRFMAEAKKQDIRVILDMVFNHSSDEHVWFKQSRSSRNNPYRDYYFWRDPVNGGPPTNWPSAFGGSAWEFDKTTGQYYLHHYAIKQPDLNWENPKVRQELYAVLNFWAAKGVTGFRFDCAGEISKPLPFRDMTPAELNDNVIDYRTTGARLDEYFKEMRSATSAYPDLYFLGEGWGMPRERIVRAIDDRNKELSSAFRFDFMLQNIQDGWRNLPWSLQRLKDFNRENQFDDDPHVWPIVFIEDHDFSRSVSRFGSTRPEFRERSAKLLATMLLSLRGTPLIYQGEEIGMSNFPFTSVSQYDDIGVYNLYKDLVETGKVSQAEYLANNAITSRDNSRTPMQWDTSPQAGFTASKKPWLAVNPNYPYTNVASEAKKQDSVLSFYQNMIRIRKSNPSLIFGSYHDISGDHPNLYAYERSGNSGTLVVVLNFSDDPTEFPLPAPLKAKRVIVNNVPQSHPTLSSPISLLPWQSLVIE